MITYDFGQSLSFKFFFIEQIFMLYIQLDSEFEGLSYEGTLFFSVFCENICSHTILGKVCLIKFFYRTNIYVIYTVGLRI